MTSSTSNREIMTSARQSLEGKWGLAVGTVLLYVIFSIAVQAIPGAGFIASILITGPMSLGFVIFFLSIARKQETKLELIFNGFKQFSTSLVAYLFITLFVILWLLLLIIPGIIAIYSYSLTYYIIADDDSIQPLDAIAKSKEMMRGHKWKLFCLYFSFIGWIILALLTLGIGFLWLAPYMGTATAHFYEDVKGAYIDETPDKDVESIEA